MRTIEYLQDECDIDNECAGYKQMNNEMNVRMCEDSGLSEAGYVTTQECEFTRKGMCKTHKIKGNRMEVKTMKWKKKKFDYGWVTTTTVRYSCNLGSVRQIGSDNISQVQHSDLSSECNGLNNGDYLALVSSNINWSE